MNAGAYGSEMTRRDSSAPRRSTRTARVARADRRRARLQLPPLRGRPRTGSSPPAMLRGAARRPAAIAARMAEIQAQREATPADPHPHRRLHLRQSDDRAEGRKAWELIDARRLPRPDARRRAGVGEALQFPDQHRRRHRRRHRSAGRGGAPPRARATSASSCEWEIRRIGVPAASAVKATAMSKRVAVLMGGWSAEREVSLVSGAAVRQGAREAGYDVTTDRRQAATSARCSPRSTPRPDVVFNALHGRFGEDGCVQGVLELAGHSLHPFRRARLGAGHGQADRQARVRAPPASAARRRHGRDRATLLSRRSAAAPLCRQAGQRGLQRRRAHRAPGRQPQPVADADWHFGEQRAGRGYIPGRELTVARHGRPRAGASPRSGPTARLLRLRREIHRGQDRAPDAGADPQAVYDEAHGRGAGRAHDAGLPRRQPRRLPLRRHRRASRTSSTCSRSTPSPA